MRAEIRRRAVGSATRIVTALGLDFDRGVVLSDSNSLVVRLLPCDIVARIAPETHQVARLEVDLARGLSRVGAPVAGPDPRIDPGPHADDGFVITLWTHYPTASQPVSAASYAQALRQVHAGMRTLDVAVPHFTERVHRAEYLTAHRHETPDLADDDRALLAETLRRTREQVQARHPVEQLLHGEPHPGNLLATASGPRFIDFETACRGPVEFDLAHAPEEAAALYPGADPELLAACRLLSLAVVTTWRWERTDQLPDGRRLAREWLQRIRSTVDADGGPEVGAPPTSPP